MPRSYGVVIDLPVLLQDRESVEGVAPACSVERRVWQGESFDLGHVGAAPTLAAFVEPWLRRMLDSPYGGSTPSETVVVGDCYGAESLAGQFENIAVRFVTNRVAGVPATLDFPYTEHCCPCLTCGVCKQWIIREAQRSGQRVVLVTESSSDRKSILLADIAVLGGPALHWALEAGVVCTPFSDPTELPALVRQSISSG